MHAKRYILLVIGFIVLFLLAWFLFPKNIQAPSPTSVASMSFAECVTAGYPVLESHPRQCRTPDGRTYTEELQEKITYVNASADLVVVDVPFAGAVVGKTFAVIGKARGGWFFEASFPVEVLDKDGTQLALKPAQAQGEWMTENFVPFKVELTVPHTYIGPATLVLHKDNPSGLPQNEASVSFPITIEY